MSSVYPTINADQLAEQIALVGVLLASSNASQPVWRWLEYQAYEGFVEQAKARYQIPDNFDLYEPDAQEIQDWVAGLKNLKRKLTDELVRLLLAMKEAGSALIEELCTFYCAYKLKLAAGVSAARLLMNVAQIKAILIAYTGDMLYAGGIPITAFAALLLQMGLLESICNCAA